MQIQLYVPEHFSIDRDSRGRIVSVGQADRNKIELSYNDDAGPISVPGDDTVRGWKFRSIRFVHRQTMIPEDLFFKKAEWHDTGWSITGVPSGSARIETGSPAFPDLKNRYTEIAGQVGELNSLIDMIKPKREGQSAKALFETAINLGHLSYALQSALVKGEEENLTPFMQELLDLPKKAWQYTVSSLIEGPGGTISPNPLPLPIVLILQAGAGGQGAATSYNPSGDVATPADASSQRLALSNVASADNEKKAECNSDKAFLMNTLLPKYAYENMDLLKLAQNYHADGSQYSIAVAYFADKIATDFQAHNVNEICTYDYDAVLNAAEQARSEYAEHDPVSIPGVNREDLIKILTNPGFGNKEPTSQDMPPHPSAVAWMDTEGKIHLKRIANNLHLFLRNN